MRILLQNKGHILNVTLEQVAHSDCHLRELSHIPNITLGKMHCNKLSLGGYSPSEVGLETGEC